MESKSFLRSEHSLLKTIKVYHNSWNILTEVLVKGYLNIGNIEVDIRNIKVGLQIDVWNLYIWNIHLANLQVQLVTLGLLPSSKLLLRQNLNLRFKVSILTKGMQNKWKISFKILWC